jgi:hypothetical protein
VREVLAANGERAYGKGNILSQCELSTFAVRDSNSRFHLDVGFLGGTRPLKPVTTGKTGKERAKLTRSYDKACLEALEKVPEVKGPRNSNKVLVKDIWEDGMA